MVTGVTSSQKYVEPFFVHLCTFIKRHGARRHAGGPVACPDWIIFEVTGGSNCMAGVDLGFLVPVYPCTLPRSPAFPVAVLFRGCHVSKGHATEAVLWPESACHK